MEVDVRLILLAILYAVIQAQDDSSRGKMFLLLFLLMVWFSYNLKLNTSIGISCMNCT